MKKFSAILVLFLTLLLSNEVKAAELIYSVDDAVSVMSQTIAAHEDEVSFEAYLDVTHENFGQFFKDVLVPQFNAQNEDYGYLIKNIGISYLCMNGKCDGSFKFTYYAPKQSYLSYKRHIQQLASKNQHLSYEEKIAFVNSYIVQNAEYDHNFTSTPSPHSPVTIYEKGLGVCQAYAIFAYDLLKALGITSYLLDGVANGEAHLWNVLRDANGTIAHLDTTWNDTSRTNNYYLISSSQLAQTHTFDSTALQTITNRLNALPDPNEEDLKPDFTHHAMYVYAKEFLDKKHTIQKLTDLGTLSNDKAFEIKFNQNVASSQDFKMKVFITDDTGKVVDVKPIIDGQFVRIYKEENQNFEANTQYNLVILKGIESATSRDIYLKDSLYVTFKMQ